MKENELERLKEEKAYWKRTAIINTVILLSMMILNLLLWWKGEG